jgi:hypothetical protein
MNGYTVVKQETKKVNEGKKSDSNKLRYDLVLPEFEDMVAAALTFGANTYGANTWQNIENAPERYYAALRRHISAWRKGEKIDPESGLSHLAHAASNLMFLAHFDEQENE